MARLRPVIAWIAPSFAMVMPLLPPIAAAVEAVLPAGLPVLLVALSFLPALLTSAWTALQVLNFGVTRRKTSLEVKKLERQSAEENSAIKIATFAEIFEFDPRVRKLKEFIDSQRDKTPAIIGFLILSGVRIVVYLLWRILPTKRYRYSDLKFSHG